MERKAFQKPQLKFSRGTLSAILSQKMIRKFIFIYSILFLLFSCNKSIEPIKVYSWGEYEKAKSENPKRKIIVVDTICPYEIKRAKKDILKNKLVYKCWKYPDGVIEELNLLTGKYNITSIYRPSSCIPAPQGFTERCYENLMNKEIEKRHGEKWIDSLERIAVKNYVIKHPNESYEENGIDLRTKYLNK